MVADIMGFLDEVCVKNLQVWAAANGSVRELWLFGSRARGTARANSDADIAIALMPPEEKHDWALGNLIDLGSEWKKQLDVIVGCGVDLRLIQPGTKLDCEVRTTGKLLWAHA